MHTKINGYFLSRGELETSKKIFERDNIKIKMKGFKPSKGYVLYSRKEKFISSLLWETLNIHKLVLKSLNKPDFYMDQE